MTISYKYEYDEFGTIISFKWYDEHNNLWSETTTLEIDSKANGIKEFLNSDKHLIIKTNERNFSWSNELCEYYLKKEGEKNQW